MRLWLKFVLATGVAILLSLAVAGFLAGVLIERGFDRFVRAQENAYVQRLVPALADYYGRARSWAGLEVLLGQRRGNMGAGMGMAAGSGMRLILLDADFRVVLDSQELLEAGRPAPDEARAVASPIQVQGQTVGYLLSGASLNAARSRSAIEQAFLRSMAGVLATAGLVGTLAALLVALVLALQITAPARALTRAARRMAAGDLAQRVAISSGDELGQVGAAFNDMAAALARQEELRRQLVADVAHELRTPLAVMKVELESLQDGLSEPTPEVVASLNEEVGLLSRLVEDLRLLSLMDAGRLGLQFRPVSLAETAQGIFQQLGILAGPRDVTLASDVAPDLPAARADPDRLRQVLLNLVGNALQYTPPGGVVRLTARSEGTELHLQVADTGAGIAPQDLPHIFDRFYRTDASRARATGGSGLGLSIARGLVEAMGGHIWAESAVGKGTTVHFTLPRA